jgi:hypothetical protein
MPTKIRLALGLMWLLWTWNAVRLLLAWLVVIRSGLPNTTALGIIYALVLVPYALLIWAVTLGRNWARFTYSGLAVIGVVMIFWEWFLGGLTSPQRMIWAGLVIIVHSTVLACLFHSSSRPWFNKSGGNATKTMEPTR